MKVTD